MQILVPATHPAMDPTLPGKPAAMVIVGCLKCGKMRAVSEMVADLDGPSFRAYFCADTCVPTDPVALQRLYQAWALTDDTGAWRSDVARTWVQAPRASMPAVGLAG